MSSRLWLMVFLVSVADVAGAADPVISKNTESLPEQLRHYAEAFGLPAISASESDEIRVWTYAYMIGTVTTYVAADGVEKSCETRSRWTQESTSIERGDCSESHDARRANSALQLLPKLTRYDQKKMDCPGIMDGRNIMIEGIHKGSTFAFEYLNADHCDDDAARLIKKLLALANKAH